MNTRRRDLIEVAALLSVWAVAIAVIRPEGDFPLHDDWDFTVATWNFARSGHFHFTQFTAVSLRAQVLWGALWTRLFGESFEVLRTSTLMLSAASLVMVNRILRRARVSDGLRIVASLAFLFNPIFLWASCTYMTDVPFVFASVMGFYFFQRGLAEERMLFVVSGSIAVMVSWFIRQNGVMSLAAVLIVLLLARDRLTSRWRSFGLVIVTSMAIFAALLLWKRDWLSGSPEMFAIHYQMWNESSFRIPEQIAVFFHYGVFNAQNAALFFLPLTLPLAAAVSRHSPRWMLVLLTAIAIPIVWRVTDLAAAGYLVPYSARNLYSDILPGPILFDFGLGPPNLVDVFAMGYDYPFRLAIGAGMLLTCVSAIAATLLVWKLALAIAREAATPSSSLCLLLAVSFAAVGTVTLFASGYYYDRYALDSAWAIGIALPLAIPWQKRAARIMAIAALVTVALFSTFAVQEYFAWNRARWGAFAALRAGGASVGQIDAGTEAYAFYELANADRKTAHRPRPPCRYLLAFRPLPRYRTIAEYPFSGFLGTRQGAVYVLERR